MRATGFEQNPSVLCPFPSAISPAAERVQQASMAWADAFSLVHSTRARSHLNHLQYGSFMARAYPTAPQPAIQLIADWNTWLFLLDDAFDEHALGHQPVELAQLHARCLAILRGAAPRTTEASQYHALHDLARRFQAATSAGWLRRFTHHVAATFAASVWEAQNRATQRVPFEAEYLHMRPYTSAVFGFLAFIEIAESLALPPQVRQDPNIQALTFMTNNVISWFNDLISYPKEIANGDVHNLVYIAHREHAIPLEVAVAYAVRKHDAEIRAFQQLSAMAPVLQRGHRPAQRYVAGLQAWIQANVDWSIATARYRPKHAPVT